MFLRKLSNLIFICALLVADLGCGRVPKDKFYASYILGRVNLTSSAQVQTTAPIVIEYSSNGFTTTDGRISIENGLGLLSVPYQLDFISSSGDYIQIRAFLDANGNGSWDEGESSGRYDRSDTGNANFVSLTRLVNSVCPPGYNDSSNQNSATPCEESLFSMFVPKSGSKATHYIVGGDIYIDSTSGL